MEPSGGSVDDLPEKNNLEATMSGRMSGDKAPKSDEESKGLLSTLFSQAREKSVHFATERRRSSELSRSD
jgi:hypothetical protein